MLRWILSPNFVAAIIVRNSKHKNPVINFSVFLENSSITRSEHTYFSRLAIHSNCDRLRLSMFNTQVNILSKNNNNLSASTVPPLMFSLRDGTIATCFRLSVSFYCMPSPISQLTISFVQRAHTFSCGFATIS